MVRLELLEDVHRLLSKAYPMEPDLPYPWHAWAEVVAFGGFEDAMARQVIARAAATPPPEVPVGYRRDPVRITHEGWSLRIPGDFAERRTPEEWWGGGPDAGITLAAVPTGSMSAQAFVEPVRHRSRVRLAQPCRGGPGRPGAHHDGPEFRPRDRHPGRLLGRARLRRGHPHRIRRCRRLAVGDGPVAVARPGLIRQGTDQIAQLMASGKAPRSVAVPVAMSIRVRVGWSTSYPRVRIDRPSAVHPSKDSATPSDQVEGTTRVIGPIETRRERTTRDRPDETSRG